MDALNSPCGHLAAFGSAQGGSQSLPDSSCIMDIHVQPLRRLRRFGWRICGEASCSLSGRCVIAICYLTFPDEVRRRLLLVASRSLVLQAPLLGSSLAFG